MSAITKYPAAFILFLITIAAGFVAYYSTVKNNQQTDNIQELGKKTKELGELNKSIGQRVEIITTESKRITEENKDLSKKNIELSEQTKSLISEVQHLTEKSKILIDKIEATTTKNAKENLQSGGIKLIIKPFYKENDTVRFLFGRSNWSNNISRIKENLIKFPDAGSRLGMGTFPVVKFKLDNNNKILFSVQVYDLDDNLIVEVKDNYWWYNKNFISKYNYDDTGFEVLDNKGHIVISIDVLDNNTIRFQGIFADLKSEFCSLIGQSDMSYFNKKTKLGIGLNPNVNIKTNEALEKEIEKLNFKRLFKYSGKDWLGMRNNE